MALFGGNKREQELLNEIENLKNRNSSLSSQLNSLKQENNKFYEQLNYLKSENSKLKNDLESLKLTKEEFRYINMKEDLERITAKKTAYVNDISKTRSNLNNLKKDVENQQNILNELIEKCNTEEQKLENIPNKKKMINIAYKSAENALIRWSNFDYDISGLKIPSADRSIMERFTPAISLKLRSMDIKDLRKAMKNNQNIIDETLAKYESKYTTKANKTIYKLMVIALQAELQNVLYNLKYDEVNSSVRTIKDICKKYLLVASEGNQSIAPTLTKFIGEIEYLFCDAVMIEYQYYVRKEQQRAEQAAIREQMKQEAAERKELEKQRKQIEIEESKYKTEIEKLQEQLKKAQTDEQAKFEERIKELEQQLLAVEDKKEEIISRQNGKAGNVYIISNLGSFGKDVFKIGMTRRLEPMDRIKELGSASVPFTFDVHSFIFSDDAVSLESKLHEMLDSKRVNKINLRKEFFKVSINELEELVNKIDPTAEFNKTMLAEEYNQSLFLAKQEQFAIN